MPQIATWTVDGTDHVGERRTGGRFRRTAEQMGREYEAAAGHAAGTVVFTIRDAAAADPRTSAPADRLVDPAPVPEPEDAEAAAVDAILDKAAADRTSEEVATLAAYAVRIARERSRSA